MKFLLSIILFSFLQSIFSGYCSSEICRRCCQVTNTGCYNAFDQTIKGRFVSDFTFCQDCDCSDPKVGCGWMAYNFGKVECASCDALRSIERSTHLVNSTKSRLYFTLKGVVITGCGKINFNGDLVFTPLPSPAFLP